MEKRPSFEIYFGGPDQPPGYLRDILEKHIAAVPSGGSIDWVTYYFRDLRLAEAIIQAHKRGVKVTLTLAGKPRVPHANDAVIARFSAPNGLAEGLRVVTLPVYPHHRGNRGNRNYMKDLLLFAPKAHSVYRLFQSIRKRAGGKAGDHPENR